VIDLKPACAAVIGVLHGVADAELSNATPCDDYTVGDLVDHVDQVCRGAIALARNEAGGFAADVRAIHREPEWREQVAQHVRDLGAAWQDPVAWQGSGNVAGSDLSNETWAKIALTELVVHGWDLARATDLPFELPEETLRACLDHVAAFVPNAPVPGLWGPPVEVDDDAPLLDQIVGITGRTP